MVVKSPSKERIAIVGEWGESIYPTRKWRQDTLDNYRRTSNNNEIVSRLAFERWKGELGMGRRGKLILSIVHSIDYLRTVGLAAIGFRTTAFYMIWEMRVQQLISDGTIWDSRVLFFLQINATLSTHFCSASIFQQSAPLSYSHGNSDRNSHFYDNTNNNNTTNNNKSQY